MQVGRLFYSHDLQITCLLAKMHAHRSADSDVKIHVLCKQMRIILFLFLTLIEESYLSVC